MINLVDDWYLDAHDYCFSLSKWDGVSYTKDKKGKLTIPSKTKYSYYSTVDSALKALFNKLVLEGVRASEDLQQLSDKVSEAYETVKELTEKLKFERK